ncbi:MAG: hypothetical protein ACK2UK_10165 [Candidatus Promineifilaceae bacterium]
MNDYEPYNTIYKLGAAAAAGVALLLLLVTIGFTLFPQPMTVSGWFDLLQHSPLIGLFDFWGLELLMYLFFLPVFLALYYALREQDPGLAALALALALVGTAVFLASNNPAVMLNLSAKYAAATDELQRTALLGAGEAALARTGQRAVGGFNVGLFLVSLAGMIMAMLMRYSVPFGGLTATIGIAAFAFSLLDFLRQLFTQSAAIALLIILPGALLLLLWFTLVAIRLWRLGHNLQ